MDEFRAQLDALMGSDRNVPLGDRDRYRVERKFSDPDICKAYLCGFCPHEEFRRTKNDCGDCPNVHDEGCRRQWEELDDRAKDRYGYEADLLKWFDRLLIDLRKRIDANTTRLSGSDDAPLSTEDVQRLDNMSAQIKGMLNRAAGLGEQGDVDGAQAAAAEAERLKVARGLYEQQAQSRANARVGKNLNQQVCKISGLIINNEESRLQDHYSGRNYNSWKKMHEVHAKLLEKQRQLRGSRYGAPPSGPPGGSSSYRERGYDRDGRDRDGRRERDRLLEEGETRGDSRRDRDKDRDRDRDRGGRDRDRDRDRRRSRSRDRGGRDRDRRRSRSRDRRHRGSSPKVTEPQDAVFVAEYVNPAAKPLPPLAPVPAPGTAKHSSGVPPLARVPPPVAGPHPAASADAIPSGPQLPNVPGVY